MTMFYPTRPGPAKFVVTLPPDFKTRFVTQCKKRGFHDDHFDEFIDMCGESIPTDSTPEEIANWWLDELKRCY